MPSSVGSTINLPVPQVTKEIRDNMVKSIKRTTESTKVKLRNVRHIGQKDIRKLKSDLPKDDFHNLELQVSFFFNFNFKLESYTQLQINKIEELESLKEKEILK